MKAEIRKLLTTDKLVIGTDRVIKLLRAGEIKKVFLASNCSDDIHDDIDHYAGDCEVVQLDVPNEELGVYCKKPFNIMVLGSK